MLRTKLNEILHKKRVLQQQNNPIILVMLKSIYQIWLLRNGQ